MMLANDELRVILVSIHVSLRDAIDAATVENELRAFHLAQTACRALGIAKPRIAVAGLNPHAGENGLFGREDLDVIVPAIALAREQGWTSAAPGRAIPFSCAPGAGVRHCGRPISRPGPDPGEISRGGSRR